MKCPICVSQNENTRDTIDVKDMKGHLKRLHTKTEIADAMATLLWQSVVV